MPKNVKITTPLSLLDLIAPHSCKNCGRVGSVLCDRCKNYILLSHKNVCPKCKNERPSPDSSICPDCPDLPPIYTIAPRDSLLGSLIHDYKYYSIRALARPLAEMLDTVLPANLPKDSILVPLPTASHHIRSRGLDHTLLVSKQLSKLRHISTQKLLLRAKNTVQVGTDRSTRLSQASSAYQLNPKAVVSPDTTYILLDDIWTTGASVTAAKTLLESAGAKNIIIALLAYSL